VVDESLESLRRELQSDPKNQHLKQRLITALIRAGQVDDVKEMIRDGFLCEYRWQDLKDTDEDGIRSCDDCHKTVHYAHDVPTLTDLVIDGHCIAATESVLMAYTDALVDPAAKDVASLDNHPCAFKDSYPLRDAMIPRVSLETYDLMPAFVALKYRVYPLKKEGNRLTVAAAVPLSKANYEKLKSVMDCDLDFEIVSRADIDLNLTIAYGPSMPPPQPMMLAGAPPMLRPPSPPSRPETGSPLPGKP
jgi:hypothetical protein